MEQYFRYYFFERGSCMDYPVKPPDATRNDTLLRMLGGNTMALGDVGKPLRRGPLQSFGSAAKAFRAIESSTQGVIVPFGEKGKEIISELCSIPNLESQFQLLRKAQQFTVNLFPETLRRLRQKDAVREARAGTGVLCLQESFYSDEFGLSLEGSERMEGLFA